MATNTETATNQKPINNTRIFELTINKIWQAWTEPKSFKNGVGRKGWQ